MTADARPAADARPDDPGDPGDPIDGAPDSGPPSAVGCATPGLFFCDDFESYALGQARSSAWTPETQNGALTIRPPVRPKTNTNVTASVQSLLNKCVNGPIIVRVNR